MRLAPDGLAGWILQELIRGEFEFSTTLLVLEGKILDWAGMKYRYSMEAYARALAALARSCWTPF